MYVEGQRAKSKSETRIGKTPLGIDLCSVTLYVCYVSCTSSKCFTSIDVDECAEGSSGCEQLCINTNGSFSCSCYGGYELNSDNKTCSQSK